MAWADYSAADGWTLAVSLRGAGSLDCTTAADDDAPGAFLVTAAASSTGDLAAGLYRYAARVTKAGTTTTVQTGQVAVTANVFDADDGALQTYAEKQLAAWQARYAALDGVKRYGMGPRQVEGHSEAEIRAALAHWSRVVAKERRGGAPKRHGVTF